MGKEADASRPGTVQVNSDARGVLERSADLLGMGKNELVSRLLLFFDGQSRGVQRAMLEKDGDATGELVKERLAEIGAADAGADLRASLDMTGALALAKKAIGAAERLVREQQDALAALSAARKK